MVKNFAFLYNTINYVTIFINDLLSVLIEIRDRVEKFENLAKCILEALESYLIFLIVFCSLSLHNMVWFGNKVKFFDGVMKIVAFYFSFQLSTLIKIQWKELFLDLISFGFQQGIKLCVLIFNIGFHKFDKILWIGLLHSITHDLLKYLLNIAFLGIINSNMFNSLIIIGNQLDQLFSCCWLFWGYWNDLANELEFYRLHIDITIFGVDFSSPPITNFWIYLFQQFWTMWSLFIFVFLYVKDSTIFY